MASKNVNRVAVLETEGGDTYIIRANPSVDEVRGFVSEHNYRAANQIPGGPSGLVAQKVVTACYWTSERHFIKGKAQGRRTIDITDLVD